jgi:hypothetical protein
LLAQGPQGFQAEIRNPLLHPSTESGKDDEGRRSGRREEHRPLSDLPRWRRLDPRHCGLAVSAAEYGNVPREVMSGLNCEIELRAVMSRRTGATWRKSPRAGRVLFPQPLSPKLKVASVQYPILVENQTITLNLDKYPNIGDLEPYAGDSLNASQGDLAGTLGGLGWSFYNRWWAVYELFLVLDPVTNTTIYIIYPRLS